jgi:hypothetical protein
VSGDFYVDCDCDTEHRRFWDGFATPVEARRYYDGLTCGTKILYEESAKGNLRVLARYEGE